MGSSGVEGGSDMAAGNGRALGNGGCTVQCPSLEALMAVDKIGMIP